MIAALIPFRGPNFAREVELRKLEAEVRADRLPPHLVDVLSIVHAARITKASPRVAFTPWRIK